MSKFDTDKFNSDIDGAVQNLATYLANPEVFENECVESVAKALLELKKIQAVNELKALLQPENLQILLQSLQGYL